MNDLGYRSNTSTWVLGKNNLRALLKGIPSEEALGLIVLFEEGIAHVMAACAMETEMTCVFSFRLIDVFTFYNLHTFFQTIQYFWYPAYRLTLHD